MGSSSDWETLQHAASTLDALGVPYEAKVVSAHRTPDLLFDYAATAADRGLEVYARRVAGTIRPDQENHFVAIDVNSEDFEIARKDIDAMLRLEARRPDAEVYLCRVGPEPAYKMGFRSTYLEIRPFDDPRDQLPPQQCWAGD